MLNTSNNQDIQLYQNQDYHQTIYLDGLYNPSMVNFAMDKLLLIALLKKVSLNQH